jgi:cyclophilin family peptidyl-prolyl cis-trans isomerase
MTKALKQAIRGKQLENLVYLDIEYGRVVIEMKPSLAPAHVKRIKELVRQEFYDGIIFHRVTRGFVAEAGDPTGKGDGGSGQTIAAEFSKEAFNRGVVGMKHKQGQIDSADSQFFILSGPAPHLAGKYTIWGRVIYGMNFVDQLKQGAPAKNPDKILKMQIAADVKGL